MLIVWLLIDDKDSRFEGCEQSKIEKKLVEDGNGAKKTLGIEVIG
jgi:hypothetical protein